ncbi:hypothetical protein D6V18_00445 [Vibrio cholerae]|nr:hypothetical protein [Vibrio cholerae]EGR4194725.1 hypothetical protein [Vibrio cholerae]KAA1199617.1 hypothetical protein F0M12_09080 [Vibrio cholerae]MUH69339.1 hypothetical protein [Vibrio cholerae]MVB39498.1 hypothetical protein [Vibrio cholerae]
MRVIPQASVHRWLFSSLLAVNPLNLSPIKPVDHVKREISNVMRGCLRRHSGKKERVNEPLKTSQWARDPSAASRY